MRKYRIIIVENDEDEQFFMKEGFNSAGMFDILAQVKNGDILFQWLEENSDIRPDIILSDLNMPGKNGYDIIAGIKGDAAYSHIPVVITSTSSTPSIIEKCMAMGATDYIVKPETFVDYVPFVRSLYDLIDQRSLVKQQ